MGDFGHIDVNLLKERPPELWQILSETPYITCFMYIMGDFGHIDVILRKERPPELWQILSETPCIICLIYLHSGRFWSYRCKFT